jgi:periplasmic protein TonB
MEVPSELIENTETDPSQILSGAGESAADAQSTSAAEEGIEGAGSSGQNVLEPDLQNQESRPDPLPAQKNQTVQATSGDNEQVPLSSDVTPPKILQASKPIYPYSAQLRRIEGTVIVSILVSPVGAVEAVRILRSAGSNYGLDQAAVAAVKRWTFTPAVQNGKRVRVWMSYPIVFKLK